MTPHTPKTIRWSGSRLWHGFAHPLVALAGDPIPPHPQKHNFLTRPQRADRLNQPFAGTLKICLDQFGNQAGFTCPTPKDNDGLISNRQLSSRRYKSQAMRSLSTDNTSMPSVDGIILAGGLSRRFGMENKALKKLAGSTLLQHVIDRVRPQVARLAISANDDVETCGRWGLPVIADDLEGHAGPLAGILAALDWFAREGDPRGWMASFPVDGPFVPRDLVARLVGAAHGAAVPVLARCLGQTHPVFGLWPVSIRQSLRDFLAEPSRRRLMGFAWHVGAREAVFDARRAGCFRNINTPRDLAEAEEMWSRRKERGR